MIVRFGDVVVRANTKEDKNNTEKEFYLDGQFFEGEELEVLKGSPLKGATIGPMFYFGFKAGQVLFMSRSFAIKKAAVARFDGICSEKTFVLETKDNNVLLQEYLVFILQNQAFWDYCEENKSGSVNFFINWSTLEKYEFDLPTIEEQRRISDLLWAAYEVKKSYRKMISSIDEMVKSQFIEETKLWENEGTIRDLIHNTVEKAGKKYSADSKIRYIDISSVDNETNTVTGVTEYIFKDAPSRAQQCVKRGDILVSTVRPNLKNIAVNHLDGEDLVASSGFCVLRPKEGCAGLIMAYILSDVFTEKMTLVAKGTNYPAIHDSDILDYKIRLPEDSKMSMIDRLFRQADKSKFELKQAIEKIDKVMRALMQ